MYNLEKFTLEVEKSFNQLNKLLDYQKDDNLFETYNLYLKHYSFLSTYNILRLSANTNDIEAKKDYERLGHLDKQLRPKFSTYKHYINDDLIKRELKHENKEIYLSQLFASSGSSSWEKYYELLISTLKDEENIGLTTHIANLDSSDELVRKNATKKIKAIAKDNAHSFAYCLNSIKKEAITIAELRGFTSVLEMSLYDNRINKTTIDKLIDSINQHKEIFINYYKDNNINKYYNITALEQEKLEFTYDQATDIVLTAFKEYNIELYEVSKTIIDNNYIDIYPRENKVSGGFCQSCSIINESRILLNYTNTLNDVFTLAHELGHAFHFHLLKDETKIHQNYTLPLAESASNLCEVILHHYLKDKYPVVEKQRKNDLAYIFLDIYNRYLFEDKIINLRLAEELSADQITNIYKQIQHDTFEVLEEYNEYMWVIKPHYYDVKYNYYNYPYTIGAIIANSLYKMNFEDIKKFLIESGKKEVEELIELNFDLFFEELKGEYK